MTEGRGRRGERSVVASGFFGSSNEADAPAAESVPWVSSGESPLQLFEIERGSAYFVTGGLVAVHSAGRDRDAIWDALQRKEVYATSGRRTLLWFDLIDGGPSSVPMGATTTRSETPRFRVRAIGSFEQKPGCPDDVVDALGEARVDHVCLGECYNPSDERRPITRIEIVRIRPQTSADEPLDGLVEDPWRVLPCPADGSGCVVEFADTEFAGSGRDAVVLRACHRGARFPHSRRESPWLSLRRAGALRRNHALRRERPVRGRLPRGGRAARVVIAHLRESHGLMRACARWRA